MYLKDAAYNCTLAASPGSSAQVPESMSSGSSRIVLVVSLLAPLMVTLIMAVKLSSSSQCSQSWSEINGDWAKH